MQIRTAGISDADGINQIYNWYVQHTAITFDIENWDTPKREHWIDNFNREDSYHHLLVGEVDDEIIGFAYNGAFRTRAAYSSSTEVTIYLSHTKGGQGFGEKLYSELFARINDTPLHRAYAVIALPNPSSIHLHEKLGFKQIGVLSEVGKKHGRYHDVAWLEKKLKSSPSSL